MAVKVPLQKKPAKEEQKNLNKAENTKYSSTLRCCVPDRTPSHAPVADAITATIASWMDMGRLHCVLDRTPSHALFLMPLQQLCPVGWTWDGALCSRQTPSHATPVLMPYSNCASWMDMDGALSFQTERRPMLLFLMPLQQLCPVGWTLRTVHCVLGRTPSHALFLMPLQQLCHLDGHGTAVHCVSRQNAVPMLLFLMPLRLTVPVGWTSGTVHCVHKAERVPCPFLMPLRNCAQLDGHGTVHCVLEQEAAVPCSVPDAIT
ncbi:hypothetical protein AVEN_211522-1 [Araneus ventricosus]|uniref:Uncharacterized protein n=1 Tax=Araneus ventricosus TaxID=182803 RepID=A0A4Y2PE70_ARAVE|nr:hypothetical protein AVEN_211522-1 [Araneus ventricosus]